VSESPSKIDARTVKYVAGLSRIDLSEAEIAALVDQLGKIVGFINQLDELDTSSVEPLAQAIENVNVLRKDVRHDSLETEKALANAPEKMGAFYRVPAVLE
jgi:aspartyl-tRNA(Asn)/glutamyl-tRNA(Gln) amidotransferase subunit C